MSSWAVRRHSLLDLHAFEPRIPKYMPETLMAVATPPDASASREATVQLDRVSVKYGRNWALRDVTATFARGAVGLLGPNGAGKSTMIKALLGFVMPEQGEMRVLGMSVRTSPLGIRGRIGYMPETDAHIPGMTAVAFVAICGVLAGVTLYDSKTRPQAVDHFS